MQNKQSLSNRERKHSKRAKHNDTTGKYSSKHIRNQEELIKWKKINNQKCGGKSRHIK
uniref:Uncharacterized protein n=1 Tax=viral metagenome TaxID=1070528 RepID=A0A6C0AXE5_9ZZZZ